MGMRLHLLLSILLSGAGAQITRTCSFVDTEVEDIYVEDVSGTGASRNLRGRHVDYTEAFVEIANADEDSTKNRKLSIGGEWVNSTARNIVPFKGLYCACTSRLPTRRDYYCPVTSKSCEVWRGFNGGDDYSVSCTNENWMVAYARYMWYYLIFWFAFLALSLLLTAPGQHAIKYILSRKFPSINNRIADLILDLENSRQMQTQFSITYERQLQHQRDGWVTGYKLKIKQYSDAESKTENENGDGDILLREDEVVVDTSKAFTQEAVNDGIKRKKNDEDESLHAPQDVEANKVDACSLNSSGTNMCTICLLDIQDGDTIADLQCRHTFHADCISEWILKKNTCPLCQAPDLAEEVRQYALDADFNRSADASATNDTPSIIGNFRRRMHRAIVGDGYRLFEVGGRQFSSSDDQRRFFAPLF